MFAIGDRKWPGVSKLVEEIGELGQVLGKLMGSRGEIAHWSGNLWDMLHDAVGDALAAISFVIRHCNLDQDRIARRQDAKLATFEAWHLKEVDQMANAEAGGVVRLAAAPRFVALATSSCVPGAFVAGFDTKLGAEVAAATLNGKPDERHGLLWTSAFRVGQPWVVLDQGARR